MDTSSGHNIVESEHGGQRWEFEIEDPRGWISKPQRRKIRRWMLARVERYQSERMTVTDATEPVVSFEDALTEADRQELWRLIHFASDTDRYGMVHWRVLDMSGSNNRSEAPKVWQIYFTEVVPSVVDQVAQQKEERMRQLRCALRRRVSTKRRERAVCTSTSEAMYTHLLKQSADATFRERLPTPQQIQAEPAMYEEMLRHIPAAAGPLRNYLRHCLGR